jgi:IS1 family transposase
MVAYAIGDRSEETCRTLWEHIPESSRGCQSFSDFGEAYQKVFPQETPECVGKESGQLSHMERWYNPLRQSHARFVRKTLSFSKSDSMHEIVTRLFIIRHNLSLVT